MDEIVRTVDQLRSTIGEFESIIRADNKADLTTLREELETSLDVAKQTELRMRELEAGRRPKKIFNRNERTPPTMRPW